ncbi:protein SRC2 homolog [Bidens hawaiensis]|uniref:protein SRC2 homolog n=1 Tax=Bidens hawaiensis TaxID=980011 RepID=UPI00404B89AC
MEYRNLTLTLVSASGLKKSRFTTRMDVYAVAFISGTVGRDQKQRTSTVKHGDSDPTWNFHMKFVIDELAAGLDNGLTLVVKIKAEGMFGGKNLGEVHVPVKELLECVKDNGKAVQTVSYQVRRPSGKLKGVLSFMYEFGEKFAYPRVMGMSSREQPAGDGYQNQHPGHVYYPPPPWPVVPLLRCSSMGML